MATTIETERIVIRSVGIHGSIAIHRPLLPLSAVVLSWTAAVLLAVQAAGGFVIGGLYRDNHFVTSTWHGTDVVTLAVAVPLLVGSLLIAQRGSYRALLIWLGMLAYTLYDSAFYLFGAHMNRLFLVYVALLATSVWALVVGLTHLPIEAVREQFGARTPVRAIAIFMALVGVGLGVAETAQVVAYLVTGDLPEIVVKTGHPTAVVQALDLPLIVPAFLVAATWLWRRMAWGYILGSVLLVKGAVYMAGLCAASIAADVSAEIPLWGAIGVGCLIAGWFLLGSMRSSPRVTPR